MKLVFAADLHLRENIWVKYPDIFGDSFSAFRKLCEHCAHLSESEKTILVLGGDIFDSPFPSGTCEQAFKECIDILKEKKVAVYFILGNHDKEDTPRPELFGCYHLDTTPTAIFDDGEYITLCGIDYTRNREQLQETLSNLSGCNYLVLHSPFKHLLGFAGKWQLEKEDIPPQVERVLVGDIHVKNITDNIYSPGSLSVNGVREFTTDHGCFVIDTKTYATEYVPITTRIFMTKEWPLTEDDIPVGEPIKPVINIVYTTDKGCEVDSFIEAHKDVHFLKTARNIPGDTPDREVRISEKEEVLSHALEAYLQDDKDALLMAIDLLLADDTDTVLHKALKEHMDATD